MDDSTNERELLLQIANGNEEAFRILFTTYHEKLAFYLYQLTDSVQVAEEILQDTFLKVWMTRESLSEIDNFAAWLFTLSKNKALNALRSIAREKKRRQRWGEANEDVESAIQEEEENPNYYFNLIDEAVRLLSPQQQKVYILSRQKRLTYKEIGKELNLSPETVKSYLQLAMTAISKHIKKNINVFLFLAALSDFSKK